MSEANVLRVMSPTRGMRAELGRGMRAADAQRAMLQLRLNPSLPSMNSSSVRVGNLVKRAMTFFDTNREAAWRCLRDASTLLGTEPSGSAVDTSVPETQYRPGGLAAWQAKRSLDYIEANLGAKLAIEEMAKVVALSKSHFSRAFKCSLGSSPMAFVAARRVERAKLMMTSTRERLTDIALACGFADQSHLNRYFRRVVGTSPGLWRRMSQHDARGGGSGDGRGRLTVTIRGAAHP